MEMVLNAVIPVFGMIWLGYFLRRIGMPGADFWPMAEKLTYYLFLPSLFFISILKADFSQFEALGSLLFAVALATGMTSVLAFVVQYGWLRLDGKRFAALFQGSIRFNNYIGIPIIIALFGQPGLVIYAMIIGLTIPLSNILTVAVMTHYASEHRFSLRRMLISLATNPLIIGSVGGILANFLQLPLSYAGEILRINAGAASALGLLTVGAGIDFASITSTPRNLLAACLLKLVANPLCMLLACYWLGVVGMARDVAVVYAALPVAASSYILARQFGAHAPLALSIIIMSTLAAMGSLTVLLLLLAR